MTKAGVVLIAVLVGGLLFSWAMTSPQEADTLVALPEAQAVDDGMGRSLQNRIRQEAERQTLEAAARARAELERRQAFFPWYNHEHRHGGIAMLTPADVHHDRARDVLAQRERTLQQAWSEHPERFVQGIPTPQPLPTEVWINPPAAAPTPQPAH